MATESDLRILKFSGAELSQRVESCRVQGAGNSKFKIQNSKPCQLRISSFWKGGKNDAIETRLHPASIIP
jgi:hypothetical protein